MKLNRVQVNWETDTTSLFLFRRSRIETDILSFGYFPSQAFYLRMQLQTLFSVFLHAVLCLAYVRKRGRFTKDIFVALLSFKFPTL